MTVKIKTLEWENDNEEYYIAGCPVGNYVVVRDFVSKEAGSSDNKGWFAAIDPTGADEDRLEPIKEDTPYETLDAAKAACQTHFEDIIRACIEA